MKAFELKNNNGKVKYLYRSGNNFVQSEMPISGAQRIIDFGKQIKPEVEGYPINIGGEWHFEGEETKAPVASDENQSPEETDDEVAE